MKAIGLCRPPAAGIDVASIFAPPVAAMTPAERLAHFRAPQRVNWFAVVEEEECRRERIDANVAGRFTFNEEEHTLSEPIDWLVNPSHDVEWHIQLHKFYYGVGLGIAYRETGSRRYLDRWMALIDGWIEQTPPGFIAADVTGRRIQNWIYAYHYFVRGSRDGEIDAAFHDRLLASLHEQVAYLVDHLAPARNHRTLELYAIFLAAVVFPEWHEAAKWRDYALQEIVHNMAADLLPDGVQCELSTDYHHIVLKNYLCVRRLADLNGIAVAPEMDGHLNRALDFAMHAHRPDGVVPALSDGDSRSFLDLLGQGADLYGRDDLRYVATGGHAGRPPESRCAAFRDSGYYILRSDWGEVAPFAAARYLIFDCGPLGAGNHGHLDCLSFEAYGYGRPLVVDPGRYTYSEAGPVNWRVRFRGTASHNTVVVDGKEQTRYVPGTTKYKISGPAPDAELVRFVSERDFDLLHGVARSHEYDAVHERLIASVAGQYWVITDLLRGERDHEYDLRFHLTSEAHMRVSVDAEGATRRTMAPGLVIAQPNDPLASFTLQAGWVSSLYGVRMAAPVVSCARRGKEVAFHTVIHPHTGNPPGVSLQALPVTTAAGEPAPTSVQALEIVTPTIEGITTDYWFTAGDHEEQWWRVGRFVFRAAYLFLRLDPTGRVVRWHGPPGTGLELDGRPLLGKGQRS